MTLMNVTSNNKRMMAVPIAESEAVAIHDGCVYHVANSLDEKKRAWALVYWNYDEKGYTREGRCQDGLWFNYHDLFSDTITFLGRRNGLDAATLTIISDSSMKLPADSGYGDTLDALRKKGRRLVEVSSLACRENTKRAGLEDVKQLLKLAFWSAYVIKNATDFVITINPRHALFYERVLLFDRLEKRSRYERVSGAPAVLLRLDLTTAHARYRQKYGDSKGLYSFFVDGHQEELIARIKSQISFTR